MAESKIVAVVSFNSTNYSTWKIQYKMALIKEGFWGIVNGILPRTLTNRQGLQQGETKPLRPLCWPFNQVCSM